MATGLLALLPLGCETSYRTRLATPGVALVTRTEAVRAWALTLDGERLGWVVEFQDPDAPDDPTREYFSVRNLQQQELGSLDGHGRAWRFVPHQRDPEWVGTTTVLEGACRILGLDAATQLEEVAVGEIPGR